MSQIIAANDRASRNRTQRRLECLVGRVTKAAINMAMQLPEGLVAVVKRDCATCEMVAPVLEQLAAGGGLTVYTQDDPTFPTQADWVVDDTDLSVSWHNEIETVPTLIRVSDGVEAERIVGWEAERWRSFTGIVDLGVGLPEHRPGCGSLSVDPTVAPGLAIAFGGSGLSARRVELATLEDDSEAMFDRGWTDGLPVVPPTSERVVRMLEGTTRSGEDVVAIVPPNLHEISVEKVAINAVMAGCLPDHLPVVIAALEAICTDEFNMHGVLCTTMAVGPVFVVNGPIRHDLGFNSGMNVLGHGNRANATIPRAVQLIVRNVGGGAPGGIDRSTQGNPGKLGLMFAEDEEGSPWSTYAEDHGVDAGVSAVTAFCAEGPHLVFDQVSRSPESLVRSMAAQLLGANSPRLTMGMDAMLVISPEHMSRFADADWSKQRFRDELDALLQVEADTILRGVDGIEEGMPAEFAGMTLPKFRPGGLQIVHAGGPAGLFSSILGGWLAGDKGSVPVTRRITN